MPAGAKLKPMRYKFTMYDYREHRKIAFHAKLLEQSWDVIFDSEDVESASRYLQSMLRDLMNENVSSKTVRMSTRDPPWTTPLAKALLKKKAKAKCRSPDGCPINLKKRINAIVTENRKSLACGKMGSKTWWKKIDVLSKRKERSNPSFDEDSVRELNHYFANLCHDEDYIRPVPMDITENIPAPQLTLSQVYYALLKTKQTSTGPDNIPFWVWKENAAILAPAVQAIWNLSLSTQRWPSAWKQANVYPLPKADIPVQPQDFTGNLRYTSNC